MAVTKVGDLIRMAMQELTALPSGDNPSQSEYTDGVDWLNVMLASWSADESLIQNMTAGSFSTVVGTASYTAGSGGTAFTTRPIRIVQAYKSWQGTDTELSIGSKADYNTVQNKTGRGTPNTLFYSPTSPLGLIYFDWVPDQIYSINCEMENPIGNYTDENSTILLSDEYLAAIIPNLAVAMSPSFGVPLRPSTAAMAKRCLARIQYQRHAALASVTRPSSELIV